MMARRARKATRNRESGILMGYRNFWLLLALVLGCETANAQPRMLAICSRNDYDTGSTVRIRLAAPPAVSESRLPLVLDAVVRYAGTAKALVGPVKLANLTSSNASLGNYAVLWKIPATAEAGRYDVDLTLRDAKTGRIALSSPDAGSFAVYRKLIRIAAIHLNSTFFTSGGPVSCRVTLVNLTRHPLTGLRVEFSDRYWPWIAGPAAKAAATIVVLAKSLTIPPLGEKKLRVRDLARAPVVEKPSTHQYGVVVWNKGRKTVLDIAFSRLVFVDPPGVSEPRPYPGQYIYPTLNFPKLSAFRQFYPATLNPAIRFDDSRTMFATGSSATARFRLVNPTEQAWHGISIHATLVGPSGAELASHVVASPLDLNPQEKTPSESVEFTLPGTAGVYRVLVEATDTSGNVVASSALELGVNPLPKSILLFGAHEDDEGDYLGLARAAIENHIPIHFVYMTSGDAGSCDRYYERSCGPAEAMNFGSLRMDEARAALGHMGVPAKDVLFLGLPDGGSGQIWYDHWSATNPFLDPLLSTDHAPYRGLVEPNLPYARNAVVDVVKRIIEKYHPSVVVTEHPPSQRHIDHIVNGYVVIRALQELQSAGELNPRPMVLVDRVYNPKTAPYTPYHYQPLAFYVSGEVAARAQQSEWYYQSQGGNRFEGFMRPYAKLSREEEYREILDWDQHAGWNLKPVEPEKPSR